MTPSDLFIDNIIRAGKSPTLLLRPDNRKILGRCSPEMLWRALEWTARGGHAECASAIIPLCGSEVDLGPILRIAAGKGHAECLRVFISASTAGATLALLYAAENGHEECVSLLLPFCDPRDHQSKALRAAAHGGHARCVELLIPVSDPKANGSQALCSAASNGFEECVSLLIPASDISAKKFQAPRWAAIQGNANCLRLLAFPSSDQAPAIPESAIFDLLCEAAYYGHEECASLLIPHCRPADQSSRPLRSAAAEGHLKCVELLLPHCDPLARAGVLDAAGEARVNGCKAVEEAILSFLANAEAAAIASATFAAAAPARTPPRL